MMQRARFLVLGILLLATSGCGELREGWKVGVETAADMHRGDARAVCESFAPVMLSALSCEALEEVMAGVSAVVGEPAGECRWGYTYRIVAVDPLHTVVVHDCPFTRETVNVTVAIRIDADGAQVTGLWFNSPGLRNPQLVL